VLLPATLDFGTRVIGTTRVRTARVTNQGPGALVITAVAATTAQFSADRGDCPASLAAGRTCDLGVTYSPTAAGVVNATLSVTSNASNSPTTMALAGVGKPAGGGAAPLLLAAVGGPAGLAPLTARALGVPVAIKVPAGATVVRVRLLTASGVVLFATSRTVRAGEAVKFWLSDKALRKNLRKGGRYVLEARAGKSKWSLGKPSRRGFRIARI
jgi:hypothetical protein